jgi:hypothetical protein
MVFFQTLKNETLPRTGASFSATAASVGKGASLLCREEWMTND